ncbi:MAG: carboxypeptidase-like regulatory domain-containing protein [Bacteroidota bacterium]
MKYTICLLLVCSVAYSQHTLEGIVEDDIGPLPGVHVHYAGKKTATVTDFDGNFKIPLLSEKDTLVFSYIGFLEKRYTLGQLKPKQREYLKVKLEDTSIICHISYSYMAIGYYGGLKNSNTGFHIDLDKLPLVNLPFKPNMFFGYQKQDSNKLINGSLDLTNMFHINHNWVSILSNYDLVEVQNQFEIESYTIHLKSRASFVGLGYNTEILLGTGHLAFNGESNISVSLGLEQYINYGVRIGFTSSYWFERWQNEGRITWENHRIRMFYNLNTIGNYTEHSLGIGYKIPI